SLATLGATASGLPVAAVGAGALGELVHAGENGFLARPGVAGELAGCLALLCRDADLRARMARASVRIAGALDSRRVLARWESVYRALARAGAARAPGSRGTAAEMNGSR